MQETVDDILALPSFYFYHNSCYERVCVDNEIHFTCTNKIIYTSLSTFKQSIQQQKKQQQQHDNGHHQLLLDNNIIKGHFTDNISNRCFLYEYNLQQSILYFLVDLDDQSLDLWLDSKLDHVNLMTNVYRLVVVSYNSYVVYQSYWLACLDFQEVMEDNGKVTFIYFCKINYWWLDNMLYLHVAGRYNDYHEEEYNCIDVFRHNNMTKKKKWREKYYNSRYYDEQDIPKWYLPVEFDEDFEYRCNTKQYLDGEWHGWTVWHECKSLYLYYHGKGIMEPEVTMFLGLYVLCRDGYVICHDDNINRFMTYFDKLPPEIGELILSKLSGHDEIKINKFFTSAGIDIILYPLLQ